eukprot:1512920-Prymnesium_polylepis.1
MRLRVQPGTAYSQSSALLTALCALWVVSRLARPSRAAPATTTTHQTRDCLQTWLVRRELSLSVARPPSAVREPPSIVGHTWRSWAPQQGTRSSHSPVTVESHTTRDALIELRSRSVHATCA